MFNEFECLNVWVVGGVIGNGSVVSNNMNISGLLVLLLFFFVNVIKFKLNSNLIFFFKLKLKGGFVFF